MKKFAEFICKHKIFIFIFSCILLAFSFVGMELTRVNYDILVYLPKDIKTIEGQNILTNDFNIGSYSVALADNLSSKEIIDLEEKMRKVKGVNKVISVYDGLGYTIPIELLPNDITEKIHNNDTDLIFITFNDSTSSEETLNAVEEIRKITNGRINQGGMSSMVLDTMNLSEKEIGIYVVIAVLLCILILQLSLDSYVIPFILLANIGFSILFNLGSNVFLGEISYITKALVAVLQLGVTTDFSIFLYHSYEKKKKENENKEKAMVEAIKETFTSVAGSSLTTIVGFLVLCTMSLTLGKDLGIVMAKGVLLGVITVLTLFPSMLLIFDKLIEKTKHKSIMPSFNKLNKFIIKYNKVFLIIFLVLLVPFFLANNKVDVYYKLDRSLPKTLESIKTNKLLKENYNIVSPEVILINNDLKSDSVMNMINEIEKVDGIDFVLSLEKLNQIGITDNMVPEDLLKMVKSENYQMLLINSVYDIATDELNDQIVKVNNIIEKYDENGILAGEGPLMKDLIKICDTDFKHVNYSSVFCIFLILFVILKSFSLPFLLITSIEFAIFMNIGISYLGGSILPFIAPIVLGTIQLGATIDYAILMTSTYIKKRKSEINKKEAMLDTLNYCGSSVFVSGMCFFAATFGVGIYSKIEMIGSLCNLISRGAIISMLVVITILPSVLLTFDNLIMKTTMKGKDDKMKKNIKKIAIKSCTCILVLGTLLTAMPVSALTKNEMVYSKLNSDGTVKSILVNESITNDKKEDKINDYSDLENILNVGNNDKFTIDNKKITWNTDGKDVFYQGTTIKNLPITTSITYKLNGKEYKLDDILGKSGKVTINVKYKNNDSHSVYVNGKKEILYTPFVVTLATVIEGDNNKNIIVKNGNVFNNGKNNMVVAITTPGLYESLKIDEFKGMDEITITFDTTSFELSSIYNVITPKLIDSNDLKIFDKMNKLYTNIDMLQDNMNIIDNGAKEITKGSAILKSTINNSINSLSETTNSETLNKQQITFIKNQASETIKNQFTDDYKNAIANEAWNETKKFLTSSNDKTVQGYVEKSVLNIMKLYLGGDTNLMYYSGCLKGNNDACLTLTDAGFDIEEVNEFRNNIIKNITEVATNTTMHVAENVSKKVSTEVGYKTALQVTESVVTNVAPSVANQVKNEIIKQVSMSLKSLYGGVDKLDQAINTLSTGLSEFNIKGINNFSSVVNTNIKPLVNKIDELIKLSDNYDSFGSKADSTDGKTSFISVVDSKKVSKKVETVKTNNKNTTIWQRIKNLFK